MLRLRAFAVDLNNRAKTNTIDIVIERWSTPEEARNLKAVFVEGGADKLLSAVQKVKPRCGFVRTSTSLGWDINYAMETELPEGGKKIVLGTDRPVGHVGSAEPGPLDGLPVLAGRDPSAGDRQGLGQGDHGGQAVPQQESGTLEIENYQREPVRLNEITVVQ